MQIKRAIRHATPQIISMAGVSGSGKTYSALLMMSGLIKPGGKLGFVDTENGRGSIYSDSPGITKAIPQGYDVIELAPPFHPRRYIECIDAFEKAGYEGCVIDSGSHEWEGYGGCTDIAEADVGRWNKAKLENKRFVNRLLYSTMHIIVCLRAHEKTKPQTNSAGKITGYISLGIQPSCEKNFMFDMLLSFLIEEKSHLASAVKCPEAFEQMFFSPHMLTKADGEAIRSWNDSGAAYADSERILKRATTAAESGTQAYNEFLTSLSVAQREMLKPHHEQLLQVAARADETDAGPAAGGKGGADSKGEVNGPSAGAPGPADFEAPMREAITPNARGKLFAAIKSELAQQTGNDFEFDCAMQSCGIADKKQLVLDAATSNKLYGQLAYRLAVLKRAMEGGE